MGDPGSPPTRNRLKVIAIQYLKVAIPSAVLVWFVSRFMVIWAGAREITAVSVGAFCASVALAAIGVSAERGGDYGRNLRRPRARAEDRLSPRFLCFTTAATLLVLSLVLYARALR